MSVLALQQRTDELGKRKTEGRNKRGQSEEQLRWREKERREGKRERGGRKWMVSDVALLLVCCGLV